MTWIDNILLALRVLLGDMNKEKYSDESLQNNLVVAAQFVSMDTKHIKQYNVFLPFDILPSPEDDKDFLLLTTLKSACMITNSEFRTMLNNGGGKRITMKDGMSEITVDNGLQLTTLSKITSDLCTKYAEALFQYNLGQSGEMGVVILGPHTDNNLNQAFELIYDRSVF